jgi:hypothetical protein
LKCSHTRCFCAGELEKCNTTCKWEKPKAETLKTNCDGAYSYETGAGGWGFIIRDEDGDVISAGRGRLDQEPFNASAAPSVHLKSHDPLILLSQKKK